MELYRPLLINFGLPEDVLANYFSAEEIQEYKNSGQEFSA